MSLDTKEALAKFQQGMNEIYDLTLVTSAKEMVAEMKGEGVPMTYDMAYGIIKEASDRLNEMFMFGHSVREVHYPIDDSYTS